MIQLTDIQRQLLTYHNYIESKKKPGLWSLETRDWTKYIDFRQDPPRTYQFPNEGGEGRPADGKVLRQVMAMSENQARLF